MTNIKTRSDSLEVRVDGQTAESWSAVLAQFEDANIYQSWAYGAVRWGPRSLSHLIMRRDCQVLAAAQLRIARLPFLPAGVAYLRWGPLCHRKGQELDARTVAEMAASLREEYCKRRGLALKVIPNAYVGGARGAVYDQALRRAGLRSEAATLSYRTVLVDLEPPPEVLRKRLDQKWRNQLNSSEKNGLALEVSDGPEAYRDFLHLYQAMWKRKRFDTSVDVEEFARIQDLLPGPEKMHTFLAKKDGESVAALVCSLMGDTAIYLLGATNQKARELKAAYFLQWQGMVWLRDRGARRYDLGGIDPETNPGGYHFKNGFGGEEATQLPAHALSHGALGELVLRGIAWLRGGGNACSAAVKTRG